VNNISLDHKSMDELRALFRDYVARARLSVLNLDNAETASLARMRPADRTITYAFDDRTAHYSAHALAPAATGIAFTLHERDSRSDIRLKLAVPGRHNVSNALAAIAASRAAGVPLGKAVAAIQQFAGVKRRLEIVGHAGGITMIDDFAHNPDKIAATLDTLHDFPGRLLILFQPHGFGPLKKMKDEFIAGFAAKLAPDDILVISEPAYFGGTTDRCVGAGDIAAGIVSRGRKALAPGDRQTCGALIASLAKSGDRIVVMGARDDTLSAFAADLLTGFAV
jgi:UDP-N-acetylmuramate--alanine ligase